MHRDGPIEIVGRDVNFRRGFEFSVRKPGGGGASAVAVLNDVDYTFGTWTYPTGGRVALTSPTLTSSVSGLPLVDPSSAAIVTWELVSVDTGTTGHFNSAVDIAAGNTPSILAAGYKTSGDFVITIRGTAANGTTDTCQITIARDATKATLGDSGDNWDYNTINSAGNLAYDDGFRGFLIATGVTSTRAFSFNSSFAFTSPVTIEYADPTRPTIFKSLVISGATNLSAFELRAAGYAGGGPYANFQVNGTNVGCTNCKVLDTEITYAEGGASNNNNGFAVTGATTTAFLTFDENDTISVTHKYRGIYIDGCASVVITKPLLSLQHAQGLYYSPAATNITVIEPICIGLFKTRYYPGPDVGDGITNGGTHLEPTQVADPATGFPYTVGQKVDGLVIKGGIFLPSLDQNTGGRGVVMGNAIGAVVLDGAVIGGWGPDGFESYGFGAGSYFKRIVCTRVRSGDETFAAEYADESRVPSYDNGAAALKFTINAETLPVGATVTMDECYIDSTIFIKGTDTYAALTIGNDVYAYARAVMTAGNGGKVTAASLPASPNSGNAAATPNLASPDPVGFAAANPKTYLEALCNDPAIRTMTHKQIRDYVADGLHRPDDKGPFALAAGHAWRYDLPSGGGTTTADSATITADSNSITADAS